MAKDQAKSAADLLVRAASTKGSGEQVDLSAQQSRAERTYELLGDPTKGVRLDMNPVNSRNMLWRE